MDQRKLTQQAPMGSEKLLGFVVFGLLSVVVSGFNFGLLVAFYCYPQQVGLGFLLPYYTYILILSSPELRDGNRWEWFTRHFIPWEICRRFLRIRLLVPESFKKGTDAQYVFAVFPHGSNADFRILLDGMLYDALPHQVAATTRTLAATVLFRIPVVRELALWTGCVDARKKVAEGLLRSSSCSSKSSIADKKRRSILVLPGGQAEQMHTQHGREIVYLKKRKGFLKLAMKHGIPVVPVYVFGASDYYQTWMVGIGIRFWLMKNLGISIPIAWGQYGSLFCPRSVATTVVFGEPLRFSINKIGSPSAEEVDRAQTKFIAALQALFEAHKKELGYENRELEIL